VSEWYFPEIKFQPPKSPEALRVPSSVKKAVQMEPGREYDISSHAELSRDNSVGVVEPWSENGIILDHKDMLRIVNSETRASLTLNGRRILFVPRQELIVSPQDRKFLASKYGLDALKNIVAYCTRLPENRFCIRLGYKGVESEVKKAEVAAVNAHEYGHTIGPHLPDSVAEEMKADAFEALYMGYYLGTVRYPMDGTNPKNIHHISKSRIRQLQELGVREEEIIAHLTGEKFGEFNPQSYKRHIRPKTILV
jgi:hypothetical protein